LNRALVEITVIGKYGRAERDTTGRKNYLLIIVFTPY
jgi:hypothetical protein